MLIRGYIMPLTARFLALRKAAPVSPLFRHALRAIAREFAGSLPDLDLQDRMVVYENRDRLYIEAVRASDRMYAVLAETLAEWLTQHGGDAELIRQVRCVLSLDRAFCPRAGQAHQLEERFTFDAARAAYHLNRMELPPVDVFAEQSTTMTIRHPGGVGEVLKDPDGGSWFRGQVDAAPEPRWALIPESVGGAA
jgi:hypothetical protein